jgi:hypothetical protein
VPLADRKRVAETLTKIVYAEYVRAHGASSLIRRGLRVLCEQAQQMGLAPEDILTPNGRDAFIAIARAIFAPIRPKAPRNILGAEWQTVIQLAA